MGETAPRESREQQCVQPEFRAARNMTLAYVAGVRGQTGENPLLSVSIRGVAGDAGLFEQ